VGDADRSDNVDDDDDDDFQGADPGATSLSPVQPQSAISSYAGDPPTTASTSGGFGAPGANYSYVPPLHFTTQLQILIRNLAGIHMGVKEPSANPLHSRPPHRHTRGITVRVRLALCTVSAHQRLVLNHSHLISARGRNANWWVLKPSPFLIPIPYHSSRLSPPTLPLHHVPPIIQFRHIPKDPSFRLIVVLLLLRLCLPSPRRRLMYRRCFLPPVRPTPCRPTRVMALRSTG